MDSRAVSIIIKCAHCGMEIDKIDTIKGDTYTVTVVHRCETEIHIKREELKDAVKRATDAARKLSKLYYNNDFFGSGENND